jgi:hypothetical protein
MKFGLIAIAFVLFSVSILVIDDANAAEYREITMPYFSVNAVVGDNFSVWGAVDEWYGPTRQVEIEICMVEFNKCKGNIISYKVDVDPEELTFSLGLEPMTVIYKKGTYVVMATYDNFSGKKHQTAKKIITVTEEYYKFHRIITENPRIVDANNHNSVLDEIQVLDEISFAIDLKVSGDRAENVALIVEIIDSDGLTVDSGWVTGSLTLEIDETYSGIPFDEIPKSAFTPNTSTMTMDWIPEKPEMYSARFLFWESIDIPSAIAPDITLDFEVLPELESICGDGTIYKDGQCLPICGDGTIFQDGKCILEPVEIIEEHVETIEEEPVEIIEESVEEPKFCFLWWCW